MRTSPSQPFHSHIPQQQHDNNHLTDEDNKNKNKAANTTKTNNIKKNNKFKNNFDQHHNKPLNYNTHNESSIIIDNNNNFCKEIIIQHLFTNDILFEILNNFTLQEIVKYFFLVNKKIYLQTLNYLQNGNLIRLYLEKDNLFKNYNKNFMNEESLQNMLKLKRKNFYYFITKNLQKGVKNIYFKNYLHFPIYTIVNSNLFWENVTTLFIDQSTFTNFKENETLQKSEKRKKEYLQKHFKQLNCDNSTQKIFDENYKKNKKNKKKLYKKEEENDEDKEMSNCKILSVKIAPFVKNLQHLILKNFNYLNIDENYFKEFILKCLQNSKEGIKTLHFENIFYNENLTINFIQLILQNINKTLQNLFINEQTNDWIDCFNLYNNFCPKNLQKLIIGNYVGSIVKLICNFNNLKELNIFKSTICDFESLINLPESLQNLEFKDCKFYIDLENDNLLQENNLQNILQNDLQNYDLNDFLLEGNTLQNTLQQNNYLNNMLEDDNLNTLQNNSNKNNKTTILLLESISKLKNLQSFVIFHCKIIDEEYLIYFSQNLEEMFTNCKENLITLYLDQIHENNFNFLQNFIKLENLTLHHCKEINNLNFLNNLSQNLKELNLDNIKININYFFKNILKNLQNLNKLIIYRNDIDNYYHYNFCNTFIENYNNYYTSSDTSCDNSENDENEKLCKKNEELEFVVNDLPYLEKLKHFELIGYFLYNENQATFSNLKENLQKYCKNLLNFIITSKFKIKELNKNIFGKYFVKCENKRILHFYFGKENTENNLLHQDNNNPQKDYNNHHATRKKIQKHIVEKEHHKKKKKNLQFTKFY
ncbi:hypothetical protein ABK040_007418 [Willaertia magna]